MLKGLKILLKGFEVVAERIMGKKFPLEDKHIILTQTEMQIKKFEKHLIVEKAVPLAMPCIEPKIILSDKEMNDSFSNLGQYDWVIFTSQNAFLLLYEYLKKIHKKCLNRLCKNIILENGRIFYFFSLISLRFESKLSKIEY